MTIDAMDNYMLDICFMACKANSSFIFDEGVYIIDSFHIVISLSNRSSIEKSIKLLADCLLVTLQNTKRCFISRLFWPFTARIRYLMYTYAVCHYLFSCSIIPLVKSF